MSAKICIFLALAISSSTQAFPYRRIVRPSIVLFGEMSVAIGTSINGRWFLERPRAGETQSVDFPDLNRPFVGEQPQILDAVVANGQLYILAAYAEHVTPAGLLRQLTFEIFGGRNPYHRLPRRTLYVLGFDEDLNLLPAFRSGRGVRPHFIENGVPGRPISAAVMTWDPNSNRFAVLYQSPPGPEERVSKHFIYEATALTPSDRGVIRALEEVSDSPGSVIGIARMANGWAGITTGTVFDAREQYTWNWANARNADSTFVIRDSRRKIEFHRQLPVPALSEFTDDENDGGWTETVIRTRSTRVHVAPEVIFVESTFTADFPDISTMAQPGWPVLGQVSTAVAIDQEGMTTLRSTTRASSNKFIRPDQMLTGKYRFEAVWANGRVYRVSFEGVHGAGFNGSEEEHVVGYVTPRDLLLEGWACPEVLASHPLLGEWAGGDLIY